MALLDCLDHVASQLIAAGVPATLDGASLTLPGALVMPGPRTYSIGRAAVQDVEVLLVAGGHGPRQALEDIGALLDKVVAAGITTGADPGEVSLPNHSAGSLPVFRFTVTLHEE